MNKFESKTNRWMIIVNKNEINNNTLATILNHIPFLTKLYQLTIKKQIMYHYKIQILTI